MILFVKNSAASWSQPVGLSRRCWHLCRVWTVAGTINRVDEPCWAPRPLFAPSNFKASSFATAATPAWHPLQIGEGWIPTPSCKGGRIGRMPATENRTQRSNQRISFDLRWFKAKFQGLLQLWPMTELTDWKFLPSSDSVISLLSPFGQNEYTCVAYCIAILVSATSFSWVDSSGQKVPRRPPSHAKHSQQASFCASPHLTTSPCTLDWS